MAVSPTILVVEDDPAQRALLASWIKQAGYQVSTARNGLEAKHYLEAQSPHLVVLDLNMPEMDGMRLLRWLRGRGRSRIPVLFQSVTDDPEAVIQLLDAGADDYVAKPVWREMLLARIRALLRRSLGEPGEQTLRLGRDVLRLDGHETTLSGKELEIAQHFARHAGGVVRRQDLLSAVWGIDTKLETRTVDVYVGRLRSRLQAIPGISCQIESIYAVGYRLLASAGPDDDGQQDTVVNGPDSA
ncbi:DNA-binding response regulator [Cupriavidus basilensis OR16]|uniref:DNA-binding response regulator n=1 Tax=Cupriavidus basilensis OR16 TaxID=1127483 RepID=H1SFI8_9BURK|nr:response regulator transcription factor [Cupriavidus basilensis]EHP38720.1 DNA-binding response regulator [Cupriavidus basilensis OR16]